jgi:hypothetical protein
MDKEIRLVLEPTLRELVPEEIREDPVLSMLYEIRLVMEGLVLLFQERYADQRDYLYIEETVVKGSPKIYHIVDTLGRASKSGFITNDGTDTIKLKINDGEEISLKLGETFKWGANDVRIVIEKLEIKTDSTSAQPFRLLAV